MKQLIRILVCLILCVSLGACDTTLAVLQGMSDGLNNYNSSTSTTYYSLPVNYQSTSTSTSSKEWHDCSSCNGSGRCKHCGGSGKNEYAKNGRCGVCRGTGKCAGCNGRGGWKI